MIHVSRNVWKKIFACFKGWDAHAFRRGGIALLLLLTIFVSGTPQAWGRQNDGSGGGDGSGSNGSSNNENSGAVNDNLGTFQSAPCPFKLGEGIVEGQQVHCGYVTVPQNRQVNDGKTVQLAVAIFKAPRYMHSLDPATVLNLEGGPGASSLDERGSTVTAQIARTITHDVVLFDQRGTGYSMPSLQCTEQSGAISDLITEERLVPLKDLAEAEKSAYDCYNRLVAQGIDLDGFNTLQNAADVVDIIHALGYQKVTLYGSSYGTRLAQTVMRLHPEVVRAAVLDSVESPTYNRNQDPADAQRAFNVLFQNCAQDIACSAKYPDLENVFYQLVDGLNASPVSPSVTNPTTGKQQTVTLTGDGLVGWLVYGLYSTSTIPSLPRIIYELKDHNYTSLSDYLALSERLKTTISAGMFYSTECSENWPFLTQQDVNDSIKGVRSQIARIEGIQQQAQFDICQFWKVQPMPAEQRQLIASDLPTLVLAGEYDPITPPANSQEVANHLSHSYFFLFPGQGHGELVSACASTIYSAFVDNPDQRPDSSCLAQMTEPAFQ